MTVTVSEKIARSLYAETSNGSELALDEIPVLSTEEFNKLILSGVSDGLRVSSFFGAAATGTKPKFYASAG